MELNNEIEVVKTRPDGSKVQVMVPDTSANLTRFYRNPFELKVEEFLIQLGIRHQTSQLHLYNRYKKSRKITLSR